MLQATLDFAANPEPVLRSISPLREFGAHEALWLRPGMTSRRLADLFRKDPEALPSDLVDPAEAAAAGERALERLRARGVHRFGVRIRRSRDYPARLGDCADPAPILSFQGLWELVDTRIVAVVGTRSPSPAGARAAEAVAQGLVAEGFTIASGLAAGIDAAAHRAAIIAGGRTIAVVGTPLGEVYPRDNADLQARIAREHLLISQVPVLRHARQDWRQNRLFFPVRNATMSALSEASVIVEAGETSGTLIQARAALAQGRRVFILAACFERPGLTWPRDLARQGAVRIEHFEQLRDALAAPR